MTVYNVEITNFCTMGNVYQPVHKGFKKIILIINVDCKVDINYVKLVHKMKIQTSVNSVKLESILDSQVHAFKNVPNGQYGENFQCKDCETGCKICTGPGLNQC